MHLGKARAQAGCQAAHLFGVEHRATQVQHQGAARGQHALGAGQRSLGIQRAGGGVGVGQIHQHEVEALAAGIDIGVCIAQLQLHARIVERAAVDAAQVGARGLHHGLVQLGQHNALHAGVLEQLFCRPAIATTEDERVARCSVGDGSRVYQRLVVEKFLALAGHKAAIEAQHAAKARGVQQLHVLVARALLLACGDGETKAGVGRELLFHPLQHGAGRGRANVATLQLLVHAPRGGVGGNHALHQRARLARVVRGKVAHVHVDGDVARLRPGVDGQVRLGQQHRTGDATGLAVVGRKGDPFVIHQGQTTGVNLGAAQGGQGVGAQHVSRVASALVQISGQVQALHGNGAPPRAVAPSRATPPGARKKPRILTSMQLTVI